MRITLVSPFDPLPDSDSNENAHVGGVERVFAEFYDKLAARGHEVTLLCSTDDVGGEWLDEGRRVLRIRRNGTLFRTPVVNLARFIPKDTDLVHVPATYPFTTPAVLRKAKAMGIPAVLDFHFEPSPGGAVGQWAADVYRRFGPPNYQLADMTIVRSYAYGRSAPSLRDVPEDSWRILPNGIDPERFTYEGPVTEGEDHLLFVGRLVPYKGLAVLIHALARSNVDLPLHVVGDGPLRKELESMAKRLGVDVRFLGHVSDEELPSVYRSAKLTVLPSVNRQEAFGITLIESMACGTPVVASGLPGVRDVALFGGMVARPRDPASLAGVLERALEPDVLERGPSLAERVHQTFSWEAVTDRLVDVYQEVLDQRGQKRRSQPHSEVKSVAVPRRHAVLHS